MDIQLEGTSVSPGSFRGKVCIWRDRPAKRSLSHSEVLVLPDDDRRFIGPAIRAGAVISEKRSASSTLATVLREMDIPAIFGIDGASLILRDGLEVEVNGDTGVLTVRQQGIEALLEQGWEGWASFSEALFPF